MKVGIIGAGHIAEKMAKTLNQVESYIIIDGVTSSTSILIYDNNKTLIDQISCELKKAKRCIKNKLIESPLWTHEESFKLAKVIDAIVY